MEAEDVIKKFKLTPLPEEGGFFRVTFRDSGRISGSNLDQHGGDRCYSSCIYYLITPEEFSGLHLVKSSEIFHFYAGDPVEMIQITADGSLTRIVMGSKIFENESPQAIVPSNTWQGTKLLGDGSWALLGCTVAPGFEYEDFVNGTFAHLTEQFPQHSDWIKKFTHC